MKKYEINNEFRIKGGQILMKYIRNFSITEKTIFAILVFVAGFTALLMLAQVSDIFMVTKPAKGGMLREGMIGLPHMINPVVSITDVDKDISTLIYSGLMKYAGKDLVPDIAESYAVSDDGLTYTFKIRPDVFFHDGSELTTADIAYTIQKVQNISLKSPRRADWNNVTVNVVSPTEIQFILKQAYSPFIANTTLGIIPKHIWNNISDEQFVFSEYNIKPIGSGPYEIKSLVKDADGIPLKYRLLSSNKYYGKDAYLEEIELSFFSDEDKAFQAIEKGTISSLASISSKQATKINKELYSIISSPLPRIFGVFFNQNNNPVLAEKAVRQALELAIDRQEIIDKALDGYGIAINSPIPSESNKNSVGKQNTELAISILEKSGWIKNKSSGIYEKKGPKGSLQILSFELITADTEDLKQSAQLLKDSWAKIGAKVEIKIFDPSELYQNIIRPRKYDALLFGQLIGKDRDLFAFWHSSQRNAPGLNVAMYTNSKADSILEFIRSSENQEDNELKYKEFEEIIRIDIPAIFIYSPNFIYIVPKNINNENSPDIYSTKKLISNITNPQDRWNSVTSWYIETEKVLKIFK